MAKKSILSGDEIGDVQSFTAQLPKSAEGIPAKRSFRAKDRGFDEQAYTTGFAAGYDAGFAKGQAEARLLEEQRLRQFTADLTALRDRMEEAVHLWFQKAEHGLAQLSTEIAQRIVTEELSMKPEAITAIVKEALGRVHNSVSARIRVNPFDLQGLEERKEALLASCQTIHEIEIVADDSLSRGSTIIESDGGVIDARVESKLGNLLSEDAA